MVIRGIGRMGTAVAAMAGIAITTAATAAAVVVITAAGNPAFVS